MINVSYKYSICTIFAKNYLPQVRVLTESYLAHHPNSCVFALLCDRLDGYFDARGERFVTVSLEEVNVPRFTELHLKYSIIELLTAVKPFFLKYLLDGYNICKLCYFDPDILFLRPINEIWELLETSSIVLTPHMVQPQQVERLPNEQTMLISGAYNLGFIGLRRCEETKRMLAWWGDKLLDKGFSDPQSGLFVDQRWVDLVPGMFDGVCIHRDPGCNIAYWNISERPITYQRDCYFVGEHPVLFFHFSGYSHKHPNCITSHVPEEKLGLTMSDLGVAAKLFDRYYNLLIRHGARESENWPYAFDYLPDGTYIPPIARRLWREALENKQLSCKSTIERCVEYLLEPVDHLQPTINRLAEYVYRNRPDIQRVFPHLRHQHRWAFVRWYVETGVREHGIPAALCADMREALHAKSTPVERFVWKVRRHLRAFTQSLLQSRIVRHIVK